MNIQFLICKALLFKECLFSVGCAYMKNFVNEPSKHITSYMNSCLHVWIWSCDEVRDVSLGSVVSSEKVSAQYFLS